MQDEDGADELLTRLQRVTREQNELVTTLMVSYGDRFRRACLRQALTPDEADDAVQQTFINIVSGIHTYDARRRGAGGAEGWMGTIRHHAAAEMLRQRPRRVEVALGPEEPSSGEVAGQGMTDGDLVEIADVIDDDAEVNEKKRLLIIRGFVVTVDQLPDGHQDELRRGPSKTKQRQSLLDAAQEFRRLLATQLAGVWKPRSHSS